MALFRMLARLSSFQRSRDFQDTTHVGRFRIRDHNSFRRTGEHIGQRCAVLPIILHLSARVWGEFGHL